MPGISNNPPTRAGPGGARTAVTGGEGVLAHDGRANRPARILYVTGDFTGGGTQHYLLRLVGGLDRTRFDPTIACFEPRGELYERTAARAAIASFPLRGHLFDAYGIATLLRFGRFLRRERFDVVHSLGDRANVFALLGSLLARQPVVIASQRGLDPRYDSFTYARPALIRLSQLLFRRAASTLLVNSEVIADHLIRSVGVAAHRVRVVGQGIDTDRFAPRSRDPELVRRLDLTGARTILGIVARFSGKKGHMQLLEALGLFERGERPHLLAAGEGPLRGEFRREVERRSLGPWVRDIGYAADPSALYSLFDIFCLPTAAEGAPTALLEAMASGLPCVVGDLPQIRAILQHDLNGILVDPSDPQAIAAEIRRLIGEPELRGRLGSEARETARARYSLAPMIEQTERVYEELLARAAR